MDNQEIFADSMDIGESIPTEMVESSVEDVPEGVEDKLDNPVLNECSMDLSELNDTAPKEVEITSEEVEIASEVNDEPSSQTQVSRDKRESGMGKKDHDFEKSSDDHASSETGSKKSKVGKVNEPESSVNEEDCKPSSIQTAQQPFTEVVSEDEFCVDGNESVLNTEAVSDDEFPPANTIENLETEDVSDEELPEAGAKKRKDEDELISHEGSSKKKARLDKDKSPHKRSSEERDDTSDKGTSSTKHAHPSVKSKILPELEKYWKAVNDDPTDFTGWTYLLQYVDQESDVEAAREAYDAFLALYPYCYGYWRKYADYEKRKGDKDKCEEVFLRGLRAIPLSVDLWLHYLNFCKISYKDQEDHIRGEFERAIEICGLEFRSDRLWDSYIKWETEGKHLQNVFTIYDKLLKIPTQGYKSHFEDFEDFVRSNPPSKILSVDDFLSLRSEVLMKLKQKPSKEVNVPPPSAAPPGDDEGEHEEPSPAHADEETTLIRDKVISSQKKKYKDTVTAVLARWNFEEGIKRPYFHVKPLERCQLNTWREYLDFELAEGNRERIIILFERCLIACALYEEFWLKFLKYLEEQSDLIEKTRDVYERACCIHHPKKPFLSLSWATFEEGLGNFDKARQILARLEENVPNILHVNVRRINLERRCGNFEETANLYEKYLSNSKSKANFIVLSTKYARFCWKILNDPSKGIKVLRRAIDRDPENPRLYSQLLELTLMLQPFDEEQCINIFNEVIDKDSMDLEYKRIFAQRKLEFLEDFGSSVRTLQLAQVEYGNIIKQLKEKKKSGSKHDLDRLKQDDLSKSKSKSENSSSSIQNPQSPYSATNSNYNQSGSTYGVQSSYQSNSGQYSQPSSYSQQPFGQYNQTDQNYSGYQNWSYSQNTGYGNYNQNWGGYYSSY